SPRRPPSTAATPGSSSIPKGTRGRLRTTPAGPSTPRARSTSPRADRSPVPLPVGSSATPGDRHGPCGRIGTVSVVVINVLTVPEGSGEVLEKRFAARAGAVEKAEGFEGFQLLRPLEG